MTTTGNGGETTAAGAGLRRPAPAVVHVVVQGKNGCAQRTPPMSFRTGLRTRSTMTPTMIEANPSHRK
jgi:hypothetical protein